MSRPESPPERRAAIAAAARRQFGIPEAGIKPAGPHLSPPGPDSLAELGLAILRRSGFNWIVIPS